jgi:hypothetical protein
VAHLPARRAPLEQDLAVGNTVPEESIVLTDERGPGEAHRVTERTQTSSSGAALEAVGSAAYLELDFAACAESLERAYAAYRSDGDDVSAIRMARKLAFIHGGVFGDPAVMNGWIGRAQTLLDQSDDASERGWVALSRSMFENDRPIDASLNVVYQGHGRIIGQRRCWRRTCRSARGCRPFARR